jgi:hypothetical protein
VKNKYKGMQKTITKILDGFSVQVLRIKISREGDSDKTAFGKPM